MLKSHRWPSITWNPGIWRADSIFTGKKKKKSVCKWIHAIQTPGVQGSTEIKFQDWSHSKKHSDMQIICLYYIFHPKYLRLQRKEREINTMLLLEFSMLISLFHFKNDLEITVQGFIDYRYALWQMNKHRFCSWHACYFDKLSSVTGFYKLRLSITLWGTTLCTILKPK